LKPNIQKRIFDYLIKNNIQNFVGVPDSTLKYFIEQGLKKNKIFYFMFYTYFYKFFKIQMGEFSKINFLNTFENHMNKSRFRFFNYRIFIYFFKH